MNAPIGRKELLGQYVTGRPKCQAPTVAADLRFSTGVPESDRRQWSQAWRKISPLHAEGFEQAVIASYEAQARALNRYQGQSVRE